MPCKQIIIINKSLGMSPGKMAAQACHASVGAFEKASLEDIAEWRRTGTTKIVCELLSYSSLISYYQKAVAADLPACLIADEGRTEVAPGSVTALAIGPADSPRVSALTSTLPLYK